MHQLSKGGADFLHGIACMDYCADMTLLPRPPAYLLRKLTLLAFVLLWPSASSLQQDASSGITSLRTTATW